LLDSALYGGDDYELLFSCSPKNENIIKKISKNLNLKLTKIGIFSSYVDKYLIFKNTSKIPKENSYLHF